MTWSFQCSCMQQNLNSKSAVSIQNQHQMLRRLPWSPTSGVNVMSDTVAYIQGIFWHTDPLLGNDHGMSKYTTAVNWYQLPKQACFHGNKKTQHSGMVSWDVMSRTTNGFSQSVEWEVGVTWLPAWESISGVEELVGEWVNERERVSQSVSQSVS
jgi:hypothetical protein